MKVAAILHRNVFSAVCLFTEQNQYDERQFFVRLSPLRQPGDFPRLGRWHFAVSVRDGIDHFAFDLVRVNEPSLQDFDGGKFHASGASVTREHAEETLRRISQTEVSVTAVHAATTWTDRARQTTEYRKGRVLLAGDAAHIHSPRGGQGLKLGLGDAMNLGWKLAAEIHGTAPAGLLDTYYS